MGYPSRVRAIQTYLSEHNLEAFLVLTKINRQYISGFSGSAGAVLVTKNNARLFVDERYLIRARRESSLAVKNLKLLTNSLSRFSKVAIEDKITLRELKWLRKMGKGFRPTREVIENLRAVKNLQEIRVISKASKIIDQIFFHLKRFVKAGLTEKAVALELEKFAVKAGASGLAFEPIVAFGPNAAAPHHLSGRQKIKSNNFLLLDYGVIMGGYHSDFTRTLFIGKPNKKQEKVYNTVLEAQEKAIARIKIGQKARIVHETARYFIKRKKFGKYFTHNTGHGVGLEIHELPNFSPDSEDILRANMIVTVEPGVYIEKWGGVRIEDMVLVTKKGPKIFSKISKDLKSMIIK